MSKITIQVTDKHITTGEFQNAEKCPIALALLDAGFDEACVDADNLFLRMGTLCMDTSSPPDVGAFVINYDACKPVTPFHFEVEWPQDRV